MYFKGEPCSACPTLEELGANAVPGVMTLQPKGERGEKVSVLKSTQR